MTHPLLQLQAAGQSPWQDYILRSQTNSGQLAALIAQGDITGLTSNPAIFTQAITQSTDYHADIRRLAQQGQTPAEIFEQLAITDIQAAADAFQPVYKRTNKQDGFVSLEVSPLLAHDTAGTIAEAQRLWQAVARPNLMIKIPATIAGLPAITACIANGINVNVTLIFSRTRYAAVMEAYLHGLEHRLRLGQPLAALASVASFFVSRLDNTIDSWLAIQAAQQPTQIDLLHSFQGKAAIANAKLAYQDFLHTFQGKRWQLLQAAGAQHQRPLWASTSTKNPAYRDVMYVEPLIGAHTVNTLPPATLQAFKDHGQVVADSIATDVTAAAGLFVQLAALGIDLHAATSALEDAGLLQFEQAYHTVLDAIAQQH